MLRLVGASVSPSSRRSSQMMTVGNDADREAREALSLELPNDLI